MHRSSTMALSALMVVVGVVLFVQDIAGAAVISARLLLAVLFLAAGLGRLYVEVRRGPQA
jgi:uncharacterized membrane protein HdeD (DUF308 family)